MCVVTRTWVKQKYTREKQEDTIQASGGGGEPRKMVQPDLDKWRKNPIISKAKSKSQASGMSEENISS
jgi:hypothetical protein